jgi:transcriptional regulator GlxA family with amidase domain
MLHSDAVTDRACGHRARASTTPGGDRDEVTLERLQGAVAELLYAIGTAMQNDRELFGKSIRRAAELLDLELRDVTTDATQASSSTANTPLRGGLAPSQVRKIRNFIAANLDSVIRVEDLAALANLSRYHFSRAFRQSFDDTPHAYVMRRRIERAQGLMLTSVVPLGQIAVECGLADQAHFTKLFRRLVGETPSVWRRARATCA